MKQTIDRQMFIRAFYDCGRNNDFSHKGLNALFDYLEEYEDSTGEQIELDVIALCCDYREETLSAVLKEYNLESLAELVNNTTVIMVDSDETEDPTIIYQSF